jgi:His-Xaa-Ser system radical SAM maturase HxsC
MKRAVASLDPSVPPGVHLVVNLDSLADVWRTDLRLLALVTTKDDRDALASLRARGLSNVQPAESNELELGDVVSVPTGSGPRSTLNVLHRESDRHHTLFLTNRCNSNCLMCSQPPTPQDDSWLVDEALQVIRHIRKAPATIGITGGEPLIARSGLRRLLQALHERFPATPVEVLTNGRLFSDRQVQQEVLEQLDAKVTWLVPLYGHADFLHDFVVQARGAFDETLQGLLSLQEIRQQIQLRVVLIEPVLRILPELCAFIGRNLPFVREVALMGCEPTGFAMANREICEVEIADWQEQLDSGCTELRRRDVPFVLMNIPLCGLPATLWPAAARSISDWKNVYASECNGCSVKDRCCGLFAWHERGWKPTTLMPIKEVAPSGDAVLETTS